MEPRIKVGTTFVKPDLVAWKGQKVYVLDPIICGDGARLSEREAQKVITYNIPEVIGFATHVASEAQPGEKTVEVLGIAMNFRGAIMETTVDRLRKLGIGRIFINHLIVSTLVAGWRMFHAYKNATR